MKFALFVYQPPEQIERHDDAAAKAAGRAYGQALQNAGVFVGGAGLDSPQKAKSVQLRNGQRHIHDGPYAETKELIAGFVIIEVPDLDAALDWAARHPAALLGSIEVRPLLGFWVQAGATK